MVAHPFTSAAPLANPNHVWKLLRSSETATEAVADDEWEAADDDDFPDLP